MNEKEARNKTEKKIERQQELMLLCLSNQEFNDCKKCGQYKEICPFQRKIDDLEQALKDGETKERERIGNKLYGIIAQGGTYESQIEKIKKFVYELLAKIRGDDSPTTTGRIQ